MSSFIIHKSEEIETVVDKYQKKWNIIMSV